MKLHLGVYCLKYWVMCIRYGYIILIRSHNLECKIRFFKKISRCVRVKSKTLIFLRSGTKNWFFLLLAMDFARTHSELPNQPIVHCIPWREVEEKQVWKKVRRGEKAGKRDDRVERAAACHFTIIRSQHDAFALLLLCRCPGFSSTYFGTRR